MIHLTFQSFWVFVTWVGTIVFWLLLALSITFFIPWQNTIFGMFVLWHVCSSCSWLTAPPTAEPRNSSDRGMEQTEGMELQATMIGAQRLRRRWRTASLEPLGGCVGVLACVLCILLLLLPLATSYYYYYYFYYCYYYYYYYYYYFIYCYYY